MAYDPVKNYESTEISSELHGEIVTLASGKSVLIRKADGLIYKLRATFSAHMQTYADGYHAPGSTFTHCGVEFAVESVSFSGCEKLLDNCGRYVDERSYSLSCVSTEAYSASQIEELKAGLTDG